jgi:phage-related minor tail protein
VDIAEIGFRADTSDLEKGVIALNKLKAAASGVTTLSASIAKTSVSVATAKTAEARATLAAAQASTTASKADIKAARQSLKLARAEEQKARSLLASAKAAESLAIANKKLSNSNVSLFNAMAKGDRRYSSPAAKGVRIGSPADGLIPNDLAPNRFNTANIAAQFQDIGVTASMGMNPLTIALQQGTQLSAILNSMESPLKGIAQAFKSIINPVSLLSIGLVALVAAGIQFVDWANFAKNALNFLADGFDAIGPYVVASAGVIMVAFIPALAKASAQMIATATVATWTGATIAAAWLAANPAVLIVALSAALAAIAVWAVNASKPFRDFVNDVLGFFLGLGKAIQSIFAKNFLGNVMGDMMITAINVVLEYTKKMINGVMGLINAAIDRIPEKMRGSLEKLTLLDVNAGIANPFEGAAGKMADDATAAFREGMSEVDLVGVIGEKVDAGIGAVSGKLRDMAKGIGVEDDNSKNKKDPWEELVKGHERKMASLKAEEAALGMSAVATARLKYETELLNEAQQKNISLTPEQVVKIGEMADEMAVLEAQINRTKGAYDFLKEAGKSFVSDLKTALMEGQNAWQAFGNAVSNILGKLGDKLLNSGAEMIFDMMMPKSGEKGGMLDSIGNLLGFAKGGTFTNGVYNDPTLFKFASGASFGVMGEAGPEAVMPLHRGPDGSLGVAVNDNGGGGGSVVVNVNNYGSAKASVKQTQTANGVEIDVMIDEIVADKLSQIGSSSNQSLTAFNNRKMTQR